MPTDSRKRDARHRITEALRRELMGPSEPEETLAEFPTTRYVAARLAPARDGDDDDGAAIDPLENDSLGAGTDDDEGGSSESQPPLIIGFHPSSFGLSFLVDENARTLRADVEWGDYKREKDEEEGGMLWRRYPRSCVVEGISVMSIGALAQMPLSPSLAPAGVTISGVDDPEVTLEGVVHEIDGERAVSLFLVNRRTKGKITDRSKDERWLLQPKITVSAPNEGPVFKSKPFDTEGAARTGDDEVAIANLLYRHAREFATGHGVAAGWSELSKDETRAAKVFSDWIPDFEVPSLVAPSDATGGAELDMFTLSQASSPTQLRGWLEPMLEAYDSWIEARRGDAAKPSISANSEYADTAKELVRRCEEALARMREGLDLLDTDPLAFEAFKFANHAMWDQRIHSIWAGDNRTARRCRPRVVRQRHRQCVCTPRRRHPDVAQVTQLGCSVHQ